MASNAYPDQQAGTFVGGNNGKPRTDLGNLRPRQVDVASAQPPAERHVEHEQRTVREGEPESERLGGQPDVGTGGHAGHGKAERKHVATASDPGRGQDDARAAPVHSPFVGLPGAVSLTGQATVQGMPLRVKAVGSAVLPVWVAWKPISTVAPGASVPL